MTNLLEHGGSLLDSAGYYVHDIELSDIEALAFESPTVIGFLLLYPTLSELTVRWNADLTDLIRSHQFVLRRAGQKAWNTYAVLITSEPVRHPDNLVLQNIEEDLSGTRKIARGGISGVMELQSALLPLLPIQSAPSLEPIDIQAEIRMRLGQLSRRAVDAYFSSLDASHAIQVLEEEK